MIEVTISCPHCRRQYTMKTDPERLQRVKTRATCGRCRNSFDVASRIVNPSTTPPPAPEPTTRPALPKLRPPPPPMPAIKPSGKTPSLSELTDLAREFADAAARFTPVGIRPASLVQKEPAAAPATAAGTTPATTPATAPATTPRTVEEAPAAAGSPTAPAGDTAAASAAEARQSSPTSPELPRLTPTGETQAPPAPEPMSIVGAATATVTATATLVAAAAVPSDLEGWTLTTEASSGEFDDDPKTHGATRAPLSWIDRADPGIAHLAAPPNPAAEALEQLL